MKHMRVTVAHQSRGTPRTPDQAWATRTPVSWGKKRVRIPYSSSIVRGWVRPSLSVREP